MNKKYVMLLILTLLIFLNLTSFAEAEEKEQIPEGLSYLESVVKLTENYDTYLLELPDGTVSARLFQFYENTIPVSYVVVSNERGVNERIIEFGEGYAQSVLGIVDALHISNENYRLLYLGNLQYAVAYNERYYKIVNGRILELEAEPQLYTDTEGRYYNKGETLKWSDVYKREAGGYTDGKRHWCPKGYNLYSEYRTMDSFMSGGICSATAAYNLTVYWYHQGYTNFDVSTKAKQNALFREYYGRLGKNAIIKKCKTAYEEIFYNYGYYCTSKYIEDASWKQITSAIDKGPIHVHLRDSEIYGDHGAVGIGYVSFAFESGWTSRYIVLIDGWTVGSRYVNYTLGIEEIDITIVNPVKAHPVIKPAI